ncbi:putative RNA-directed DNA polymerase from transposon BS [Amphibalanus amphitrite]|uniref:Putative RNA-directed DNA polymerase from transposon BS n=1 Tax=Amphibalanus amphitrite TaxID=1232801 RepID=A0A6A4VLK2_AMPAM|nr:putative RNA-directed DNA polymerase from transposon BS [Amphibalanus amphitrite]
MDGNPYQTVINIYRPPIRATGDDRADNFDPESIPTDDKTLVLGDFNAHHPLWDAACDGPDEEAIRDRQAARREIRPDDPDSRARWIEAKQRAAEVEGRVSREQFREFVGTTLNRPASLGRVSKILKKWEGATDDEHRDGQAMMDDKKLLVTDKQKANAFVKTYAQVSRHVRNKKVDLTAKRKLSQPAAWTLDHRLLRLNLTEQGLPLCLVHWVWQWLRDRRTRVEVRGDLSGERVFRAGLPQGSVLSPSLFVLWAAPLVQVIKKIPGCTPYMYADDTAVLCAGNTIELARERAQRAADALTRWARETKMRVSGEKTQLLVLSQQAKDAKDCRIKVAGNTVEAQETLHLLGVTLDRLLRFGPHCRRLRRQTRPRINQLRQLTGRSWGLDPALSACLTGHGKEVRLSFY